MAAGDPLTSLDDLIALATATTLETALFTKKMNVAGGGAAGSFSTGARQLMSLWRVDGQPAGATAIPSTAAVCTNATAGALMQAMPASGARKYILDVYAAIGSAVPGTLLIYDRLSHQGGLSGLLLGAQTTNLPTAALTRRTTGVGVEPWIEVYTAPGAVAGALLTASYTNDAGTAGQTTDFMYQFNTVNWPAQAERIQPLPLQSGSGDRGVRAVASVTLSSTSGGAGNFGVTLAFPYLLLPLSISAAGLTTNMMRLRGAPISLAVDSDACLALAWYVSSATTNYELFGLMSLGER